MKISVRLRAVADACWQHVVSTEKSFAKRIDSLEGVFDFLQAFMDTQGISGKDAFAINLVTEELFTNMVKYSGGEDRQITIRIGRIDAGVELELTDYDSEPFDPASAKKVDVNAPIEERNPGGLGLHIVRTMVDDLRYELSERTLKVSVSKSLES